VNLDGVIFEGADLMRANFIRCDFTKAYFGKKEIIETKSIPNFQYFSYNERDCLAAYTNHNDTEFNIYDIKNKKQVVSFRHIGGTAINFNDINWSPCGKKIGTLDGNGQIAIISVGGLQELFTKEKAHSNFISDLS